MKAHLIDTHLLGPRSRSSAKVKVKYEGRVSQKMGVSGALVFTNTSCLYFSPLPRNSEPKKQEEGFLKTFFGEKEKMRAKSW